MINTNCRNCNKNFNVKNDRFLGINMNYCSMKCRSIFANKQRIKVNCYACNKEIFLPKKAKYIQVRYKSCSKECAATKKRNLTPFEQIFWSKNQHTKHSAKVRKLEFDLDHKFLLELYNKQNGKCHYSHLPMNISKGNGRPSYDTLSIDRIDSKKGYLKTNVVFCLNSINMLKGFHDFNDIKKVFKAIMLKEQQDVKVKFKKLYSNSQLPSQKTPFEAGYDLYTQRFEDCGDHIKIYSGIALEPDSQYYFMLVPRSSTYKKGLFLANNIGIIDNSYRNEIIGVFKKEKNFDMNNIKVGDRLMQLIGQKMIKVEFIEVDELSSSTRDGGFGSTGN